MRTLLAFFAACLSAFGAITTDPPTVARSMRQGWGSYGWPPTHPIIYPKKAFITVSGTGAWTTVVGGTLATACSYGAACFTALPASGTDAGTVTVNWNAQGSELLAVGVYTGTVTIAGNVTTITLTVVARQADATFSYPVGYPQGCANSWVAYSFVDTCTIANERPPSESFSIPAQGASYTDPSFGRTVTRITAEGQALLYSTLTAFNADNTLVMTSGPSVELDFFNLSGTEVYSNKSRGDTTFTAWDALDPDVYWRRVGDHELWKYALSTSTDTKAADYHGIYTTIANGGTADISDDNWWVFVAGTESLVCAVNLNGLTTVNQSSKTYCASYTALPLGTFTNIDFPQVSMTDSTSGKRYVTVMGLPAAGVWSVNTGTGVLDWERYLGEKPQQNANDDDGVCEVGEVCITQPHCTLGRDASGNVILYVAFEDIWGGSQSYQSTLQLNKGNDIYRPVEEGGGMRILWAIIGVHDQHLSCNGAGYCSMAEFGSPWGIPVRTITGATQGKPAEITTSASHPWANGDKVVVDQVTGNTCVNGIWTITKTAAATFTLDGSDCTGGGAYAGGGLAGTGALPTPSALRGENVVAYLNGANSFAYRTNHHRGKIWDTPGMGSYGNTPMTNISRNGAYIAYATNMGNLGDTGQTSNELAVYVAATGLGGVAVASATKVTGAPVVTGGVKVQ